MPARFLRSQTVSGTLLRLRRGLWGFALFAALIASSDAAHARPERHVSPIGAVQQLDHCRELVRQDERTATLKRCFHYATLLLQEGLRSRDDSTEGPDFEARLTSGSREIVALIEALPLADRTRRDGALAELDGVVRALRVDLSRIAAAEHMQLSLVSRGGVSLGNWQSGFLYTVTEWAKQHRGEPGEPGASDPAFSTVTGASAGAVNGFAAAIEGCKPPNHTASESLYYRIWMDLALFGRHGKPGLWPVEGGESSNPLALFTDDALESILADSARYIDRGGQLASCGVDFGFVATHLDPKVSPVHVRADGDPILTTKKLKEKFSVRLEFADSADLAPGERPVRIRNIGPPPEQKGDQVYYAGLGHGEGVPLESLMLGVRASAAFPAAFPPVPLSYTEYIPGPDGATLGKKRVATFIDGGILDNTPVGLAVALDEWRGSAQPDGYLDGLIPDDPRTYIFLEPLVRSWVLGGKEGSETSTTGKDIIDTYLAFARDLLATTTDAQLTNTAERFPFVRRESQDWTRPRLSVPERHMPITGTQFDHFMAFLERDFRIFDFYVGMADAYEYLESEGCYSPDDASCQATDQLRALDASLQAANPNYRCMRAYYESDDSKVLKRISTRDLPQECQSLVEVSCSVPGPHDGEAAVSMFLASPEVLAAPEPDTCVEPAISNHNFRTLLASMHNFKVWMQSSDYSEGDQLDRFFDELSGGELSERFIYVDLPTYLKRDQGYLGAGDVKQAFRALVQNAIDQLGDNQEGVGRYALLLGGRPAADIAFGRDYPEHILGVGVAQNGVELVYGPRIGRSAWRWDTTFRYFNIRREDYGYTVEPAPGAPGGFKLERVDPFISELYLSTQVTRAFSPIQFADLELGVGAAASEIFAYNGPSPGHVAFRAGLRSSLTLVILQRIFIGGNIDYYPLNSADSDYRKTGADVADDWEYNLVAGWRFLY